ncbi:MAG: DNA-binding NtrC family response regulator [Rhodothermales bacterium]|jgi:DNA-binding NtrC family response regulator
MPCVLIVDDIPALAEQYAYDLRRLADFETLVAGGGNQALDMLAAEPVDCLLLDLEMPGMDGFAVLRALAEAGNRIPVIVYTGTGNFDRCVQAVKLGAFGFVDKAEAMPRVVNEIQKALDWARLNAEVASLRTSLPSATGLVGSSPVMTRLKEQISRVARIPSAVLIVGESGSGKELVAREVHAAGGIDRPFVAINAGALPENLIESELFGHEKGAFTGADRLHRGAFERASGGTLFLDEIGELNPSAQAKLLRVLETRELRRVGGERPVKVTARIVAATHRDLDEDAVEGRFRTDLLFRLNTHMLKVPPLRDRKSDIPAIVKTLLAGISANWGIRTPDISPNVMSWLSSQEWSRNNVRELRNALERLLIASDDGVIGNSALQNGGAVDDRATDPAATFAERKAEAERRIIRSALDASDGHVSNAARSLGLADHASLLKIMRRLGVSTRTH